VVGDPGRLRQVLGVLLSNAVKFTSQGRIDVRIALAADEGREALLHFAVADTGAGIPDAVQAEMFEPFRQADGSVTREHGGCGLGLAIASELVAMMGGRLQVESRLGLGNRHQALLLDPRDIDLNFIPRIEWRPGIRLGDFMLFQLGLDHQCFHEIDRKETPAAYWNKFFLAARSRNWRPDLYWRMLRMKQRWIPADRFAWNLKLGCFPDELFGIVNPSKLSGNHPFKWQIQAKGRGALYGVDHWVLGLSGNANILSTYDNDWYWAQQIGIESVWGRSRGSAALFLTYDFDVPRQVPVFSRDRLLALGFRLVI